MPVVAHIEGKRYVDLMTLTFDLSQCVYINIQQVYEKCVAVRL